MGITAFYTRIKRNRLIADSFWSIFGSVVGYGLSLISGIILARYMGDETYGEFGMVKQMLIYMCIVATFGMGITSTQFIARATNENEKIRYTISALLISTAFSSILALILFLFSAKLAIFLGSEAFQTPLHITALALIFCSTYTTGTGLLSGLKLFKSITLIKVIYGLSMLIGCVALFYCFGLNGAVWGLTISYLSVSIACLLIIKHHLVLTGLTFDNLKRDSYMMMTFSIPIVLHETVYGLMNWILMLVIAKLSDYSQLGLYTAAAIWGSTIMFIPTAMRSVALSHLSSSMKNKYSHHIILKRLVFITALSVIIPMCIIVTCSGFIQSLYGSDYIGLSKIISITCISCVFNAIIFIVTQELTSKGKNWPVFISRLIGNICAIIMTVLLINIFHQPGALSATLTCLCSAIIMSGVLMIYFISDKSKPIED